MVPRTQSKAVILLFKHWTLVTHAKSWFYLSFWVRIPLSSQVALNLLCSLSSSWYYRHSPWSPASFHSFLTLLIQSRRILWKLFRLRLLLPPLLLLTLLWIGLIFGAASWLLHFYLYLYFHPLPGFGMDKIHIHIYFMHSLYTVLHIME